MGVFMITIKNAANASVFYERGWAGGKLPGSTA